MGGAWLAHGEIEGGHVRVGGRELLEDRRQRRVLSKISVKYAKISQKKN